MATAKGRGGSKRSKATGGRSVMAAEGSAKKRSRSPSSPKSSGASRKRRSDPSGVVSRGGGWYELPDGTRVRGKEAAIAAITAAPEAPADDPTDPKPIGRVGRSVQALIDGLDIGADIAGLRRRALASQALALAEVLDLGVLQARSAAPVSTELRATIEQLVGDDDAADPDEFEQWDSDLGAPT